MRKLFIFLTVVLLTVTVWAQSPQKMSYQAVIRNSSNALVTSSPVGMRVSILQGSEAGTEIYKEIYNPNPQTNANGLVTIEIGGGIPLTGTFASINWANGTYFIKTETDPTGGTNYTITGTSQLLSVPYALHAQAADSANYNKLINKPTLATVATTGSYTDLSNKPTIPATQVNSDWNSNSGVSQILNKPTLATVATSGNYNDLTNKPTTDGSETKVTAGTNVIVTGAGTVANPYVINDSIHKIGDSYGGGIVFYVYDNGLHGLIAATSDQSTGIQWYNGTYRYTGTTGDGLGAGAMNTAMIVATQMADNQAGNFAAKVCADYSVTVGVITYGDWYLPSKYELYLLYLHQNVVGGFANNDYWSSSESYSNYAWNQLFSSDGVMSNDYKCYSLYVRAIRAF